MLNHSETGRPRLSEAGPQPLFHYPQGHGGGRRVSDHPPVMTDGGPTCAGRAGKPRAQIDEQVNRRHRRDVHPAVSWRPAQTVDVIDESVERRGGQAADVIHDSVAPTSPVAATIQNTPRTDRSA